MAKAPQVQNITQTTSNIPSYAEPYWMDMMQRAQGELTRPYTPYGQNRLEGLNQAQKEVGTALYNYNTPWQMTDASGLAALAGQKALNQPAYQTGNFSNQTVTAQQYDPHGTDFQGAQTNWRPDLNTFQMGPAGEFGQQQAGQYMSPYFQNVVDVQKGEAVRDAQKTQLGANLGAARQGTYGGARQLLAQTERERALGQQLGNIQATGTQAAYENAQQQYERDRQAGLGVAGQNLQAQLGVQQLGAQTGTQLTLANLSNEQQALVQNQAAQLQTQGLNAQQAMQAALANQQADLQRQQMTEQSRQFGGNLGLQGLAQANQSAQTLGNLGASQQQMDYSRYNALMGYGDKQQAMGQAQKDLDYGDFTQQRDWNTQNLGNYSNILRGLPITPNQTQTTYGQAPSTMAQVGGAGVAALAGYNMLK